MSTEAKATPSTGVASRVRVLLVEDNPADVELCRRELLKAGFELCADVTDRKDEFCALVTSNQYDLILADYSLPGWNADDALEFLDQQHKQVPFILVTGSLGDEKAVECIKAGAADYVLKENLVRLPHSVQRALNEARLRRQQRRDEAELRRLNRALVALSRCDQAMLEARDEESLLQAVCDLLVEVGGYRLAWVGYVVHDARKTVQPVAHSEVDPGYLEELDVRWDESERGRGPTGTAIRSGQACVITSTVQDERYEPWRQRGLRYGFAACAAIPLFSSDAAVFGSLNIYAAQEDAFQPEEITLLKELAGDMAYGISALRGRAAQEQAEAELRKSAQDLAKYAAELERSNAELQDFASIASHDLQEPLRKVTAFGDRLAEHLAAILDETGKDYLQRMQNAAERMSHLLQALLEYSRVSTRAQPFQAVDLVQLMFGVLADLEVGVQESQARVQVGSLPVLQADRLQMHQLLQNLVSNALKFHRPGVPPQVVVESTPVPSDGWEITVSDNGIGFDERYLDRIFRPFQRLHGRSEFQGTGMGLAICRKIVSRHGGSITAHSQPGQGSSFVVTLPGAPPAERDPCSQGEIAELSSSPRMMTTTSC